MSTIKSGGQTAAVWGSEEKPLIVRGDVTGKSYKLEFKISYDDGEKSYETDKYVFVKTTAKEKPSENQGGNANGGEINNGNTGNGSGGSGNAQGTPDDSGAVFGGVYTSDPVMAGGSAGGADAVSYTHLDVYKRQVRELYSGAGSRAFSELQRSMPNRLLR